MFLNEKKRFIKSRKLKNAPRPNKLKLMWYPGNRTLLTIFVLPFYGRDQPQPCLESRGEGSAASVLRLQPPVAGADAGNEDVTAYSYRRSRP